MSGEVLRIKFVSVKCGCAELANNAASSNDARVGMARRRRQTLLARVAPHQRNGAGAPEIWDAGGAASLPIVTSVLPHELKN